MAPCRIGLTIGAARATDSATCGRTGTHLLHLRGQSLGFSARLRRYPQRRRRRRQAKTSDARGLRRQRRTSTTSPSSTTCERPTRFPSNRADGPPDVSRTESLGELIMDPVRDGRDRSSRTKRERLVVDVAAPTQEHTHEAGEPLDRLAQAAEALVVEHRDGHELELGLGKGTRKAFERTRLGLISLGHGEQHAEQRAPSPRENAAAPGARARRPLSAAPTTPRRRSRRDRGT